VIGVYFQPKGLTLAQFDEVDRRVDQKLEEAGQEAPEGAFHTSCFGEDGQLSVFQIWESPEAFEKFGNTLMPILAEVGVEAGQPTIVPVHRLEQTPVEA
jgi:hypothetical protein